ncbi:TraC family protein [Fastidiosibacter lacustris]|uniref:TraC family protein n=1 Tax=Fastidiosibacter lacustris TaxID=2056695 RepID=UPI000E34E889|nr:TraC family protein [Fastidiosibacter lacustris]
MGFLSSITSKSNKSNKVNKRDNNNKNKDVIKQMMQQQSPNMPMFHHELPYRYFDREHKIFINEHQGDLMDKLKGNMGNKVGFGFAHEISPLSGSSPSVAESLNEMICKKLPTGKKWAYQFVLTADRKVSEMIETNREIHAKNGGMYEKLAQYQADMANKALTDGFNHGFGKGARFDLKNYRSYFFVNTVEDNLKKLLEVKEETENDLSAIGTSFRDMDAEDLIAYVEGMVNHNTTETTLPRINYNPYEELSQQVYDRTTQINASNPRFIDITFHDATTHDINQPIKTRVVCLTLKKLPSEIYHWHLPKYLSSFKAMGAALACPFMWSLNFQIESKATSEKEVNGKITSLNRAKQSGLGRFMPFLEDELEENMEAQRGLAGDIYRLCNFSVDLILYTNYQNWRADVSRAMNLFRDGLELFHPIRMQNQVFLSCLPFMYTRLSDDRKVSATRHRAKSSNIANMAPMIGDYKGAYDQSKSSPYRGLSYGLLTPTRTNQIAYFSPFIMGTDSYNIVIAGSMGSGKSVLGQSIILDLLSNNGLVFALDKGGSYRDMCRAIGGQMIHAASLHLNPFSHLDYEAMQRDPDLVNDPDISIEAIFLNSLSMITELYAMIGRPNEIVTDFEKNFLNGCVTRAYAKKQTNTLVDDVVAEIASELHAEQEKGLPFDRRKADWIDYLYKYTSQGSSPEVFNKPSMLDPKANFICIETEGVPAHLKNPVTMALTIDIDHRIILSESARPKGFVIEEVGAILKNLNSDALRQKIEEGAATYRKKGATLITITQEVEEFFHSPLLQVIYNKSELKMIMRQGDSFAAFAKEKELFDTADIEQIKRFKKSSEAMFSTFLLKNGNATSIHHFYLDPYSKVLTSTKPEDMAAIKAYRKQGYSIGEAVEQVMWDYYGEEAQALMDYRQHQANAALKIQAID